MASYLPGDVNRAMLALHVDVGEVLADDAERQQDETAYDEEERDDRGVACWRVMQDHRVDEDEDDVYEADKGEQRTDVSREEQGHRGERHEACRRVVQKRAERPLAVAGVSLVRLVLKRTRPEAHP